MAVSVRDWLYEDQGPVMGKLPAFMFYPNDWMHDTRRLSLQAKGAWIDILCAMWYAEPRGKLICTFEEYGRIIGSSGGTAEVVINELTSVRICDFLTEPNGLLTIISRRMAFEDKERESGRLRSKRHYEKKILRDSHGNLTLPSSIASSSSTTNQHKALPPTPANNHKEFSDGNLWIKTFLDSQRLVEFWDVERMALLDPDWWVRTAEACYGIDEEFLRVEFAKMGNWLSSHKGRRPTKKFVQNWLTKAGQPQ